MKNGEEDWKATVEITARVQFKLLVHVDVTPLEAGTMTPAQIEETRAKVAALIRGSQEQIEAGIYGEIEKRVPGINFASE